MNASLRLGTRGSRLALLQSTRVAERLRAAGHPVELVTVVTEGDLRPVDSAPGEGVFVTALERALAAGDIDIAVHSAKDVPLQLHPGLVVAAHPERGDPRDALVSRAGGRSLAGLARGAVVGTDSPRRAGFLLTLRPDLRHVPFHGNVDSRLRRLEAGAADALVLAAAGLDRLGLGARIDTRLDPWLMAPAPGQGALAVEARADDGRTLALLATVEAAEIRLAVVTERRVLEATGGTCRSPVGALATVAGGRLRLLAAACSPDGTAAHRLRLEGEADEAGSRRLAETAAAELLRRVALPA